MRRATTLASLFFLLMAGDRAAAGPDEIAGPAVRALAAWVNAVKAHAPGRLDAGVAMVSALTFDQRRDLNAGMSLFLNHLSGKAGLTRTQPEKQIADIGRATRHTPGPDIFLKRAAVLHSDAALAAKVDGANPPRTASGTPARAPASPLLSDRRMFLDKDGEIVGVANTSWNWPFARSLLDLVGPKPGNDPFVAAWYHATTALMLQKGWYAEVSTHLRHAGTILPDDMRILFDRATYAEIQGLPVHQVLLSDEALEALRARRVGRRPSNGTTPERFAELGIRPPEEANTEAERLFRRTLSVDPSFIEARVRLARLLHERKRYEEAARELSSALASKPTGPVAFYAHMFAGRAAQALGRIDQAAGHYRDAAALFPNAQSALLAQSQVALLAADVSAALEPVRRMETRPPTARVGNDPWWEYHLAAGRDADALLRKLWARLEP